MYLLNLELIKNKNLTQKAFFLHMKGARPRFTRAITQPLSTLDVSLAAELTSKSSVTEKPSAKPGFDSSISYFLACIGIL